MLGTTLAMTAATAITMPSTKTTPSLISAQSRKLPTSRRRPPRRRPRRRTNATPSRLSTIWFNSVVAATVSIFVTHYLTAPSFASLCVWRQRPAISLLAESPLLGRWEFLLLRISKVSLILLFNDIRCRGEWPHEWRQGRPRCAAIRELFVIRAFFWSSVLSLGNLREIIRERARRKCHCCAFDFLKCDFSASRWGARFLAIFRRQFDGISEFQWKIAFPVNSEQVTISDKKLGRLILDELFFWTIPKIWQGTVNMVAMTMIVFNMKIDRFEHCDTAW